MKTASRAMVLKIASFMLAVVISLYSMGASVLIFTEIIPVVKKLNYTDAQTYGIMAAIALVLMWLMTLVTDSAEHIVKTGFKKADKIIIKGENNE